MKAFRFFAGYPRSAGRFPAVRLFLVIFLVSGLVSEWVPGSQAGEKTAVNPTTIEVFTTARYPITGLTAIDPAIILEVYDLDAPQRFDESLSAGLPVDPVEAERLARARLTALDSDTLVDQVQIAYAGAIKALEYGLDRIPAMVFDQGAMVVYGVTDLTTGLAHYRRWREAQP